MPAARIASYTARRRGHADRIEVERVTGSLGRGRRGLDVEIGEQLLVLPASSLRRVHEALELRQLRGAERALQVGDAGVRRELGDLVEPAAVFGPGNHSVRAEAAQPGRELQRVRRDRAAFTGRDRLHRVEREHARVGMRAVADRPVGRAARRARGRRPRSRRAAGPRCRRDRSEGRRSAPRRARRIARCCRGRG